MLSCKGQCDFSTHKDSVCLLSNFVDHVLIVHGPLGSFFSFVILLYILLSCQLQKSRINLQILGQAFLCLGLNFQARTHTSCSSLWSESYELSVKSQKVSSESGQKAWQCWKKCDICTADYHSKLLVVKQIGRLSADSLIKMCKIIFSEYGFSRKLMFNTDTNSISKKFWEFCRYLNIHQAVSHYPTIRANR